MTWIGDITVRGVRHIDRWDVTLPDVIGPPHAVLVGPCGSGKSSVLAEIGAELDRTLDGSPHPSRQVESKRGSDQDLRMAFFGRPLRIGWTREAEVRDGFASGRWIAVAMPDQRAPLEITAGRSAGQPDPQRPDVRLAGTLGGLLAQRRSEQRLAEQRGDTRTVEQVQVWLDGVRGVLRRITGDDGLSLVIGQSDVAMDFSDGRRLPFAALSGGHAGALTIWAELFLRAEAARRQTQDPSLDPKGLLIVDAVEVFLDPRLQRTLLPLLAGLFPGVQILASTSSPIVASSLEGATVIDLAARKTRKAATLPPPGLLPPKAAPPSAAPPKTAPPKTAPAERARRMTHPGSGPWDDSDKS